MRAIVLACACATGCGLYFGPSAQDAPAPTATPDGAIAVPDAVTRTPPDPPAACSAIAVYVTSDAGDPRAPFLIASIRDALAFDHVPITSLAPTGAALTVQLSPTATAPVAAPEACGVQTGATAVVADDRSRANDEIVANALRGLGLLYGLPQVDDVDDCMYGDHAPAGCWFGRADTIALDACDRWTDPLDEAQALANDLGCPGVGP